MVGCADLLLTTSFFLFLSTINKRKKRSLRYSHFLQQIIYCDAKQKKDSEVSQKKLLVFSTQKLLSNNHGKKSCLPFDCLGVASVWEKTRGFPFFFSAAHRKFGFVKKKKKLCFPFPLFLCYFFQFHPPCCWWNTCTCFRITNQFLIWSTALQWDNAVLIYVWSEWSPVSSQFLHDFLLNMLN